MIDVEVRRPPPDVLPFGAIGAIPSRTLYIDPEALQKAQSAGRAIVWIVALAVLIPILIPVGIFAVRGLKGKIRPFPATCEANEEIELSGNWEGTEPIFTKVGANCKIHIHDSKLKGTTLFKSGGAGANAAAEISNLELTLENVTIETTSPTEPMVPVMTNIKVTMHGTNLKAAGDVFVAENNLEILDFVNSNIESTGGSAVKAKYNFKLMDVQNSKIKAKKTALDTDANVDIVMKKASEITSSEGIAIKTTSSLKLDADGGKIEGAQGAIVTTSGANITAKNLTIASSKASAITSETSLKLDDTDGTITASGAGAAIATESNGELTLTNVKLQGVDIGIGATSGNLKLKALKKTTIVATRGNGVTTGGSAEINVNDASIEGANKAVKAELNAKFKLGQGARLAGKRGGLEASSNSEIDGTGATIDGGAGPGILTTLNMRLTFRQGLIKGVPAIQSERRAITIDLEGTKIDGEQKLPAK